MLVFGCDEKARHENVDSFKNNEFKIQINPPIYWKLCVPIETTEKHVKAYYFDINNNYTYSIQIAKTNQVLDRNQIRESAILRFSEDTAKMIIDTETRLHGINFFTQDFNHQQADNYGNTHTLIHTSFKNGFFYVIQYGFKSDILKAKDGILSFIKMEESVKIDGK